MKEEESESVYRIQHQQTKLFWQSGSFRSKKGKEYRLSDVTQIVRAMSPALLAVTLVIRYEMTRVEQCPGKDASERYKKKK